MNRRGFLIVVSFLLVGIGLIIFISFGNSPQNTQTARGDHAELMPDWPTIALWPFGSEDATDGIDSSDELNTVSTVDPWQVTTIIVLDDSASMVGQIKEAKEAIVQAVSQFSPDSRVGVIALNAGLVSEVVSATEAADRLPEQLRSIFADGSTPLGRRLDDAAEILATEAERRRGFGVFRILVTTDGEASDADQLHDAVSKILSKTPIELATIGIGIGEGHALNVPGFTSYVSVSGVDGLAGALAAAAAEQTTFQPIDHFEE